MCIYIYIYIYLYKLLYDVFTHSNCRIRATPPRRSGQGGGRGRGGQNGGRQRPREENKNVKLKAAVRLRGLQSIDFEIGDKGTYTHVGPNQAWFGNYVGELIRQLPLHYDSWYDIEPELTANFLPSVGVSYFIFLLYILLCYRVYLFKCAYLFKFVYLFISLYLII